MEACGIQIPNDLAALGSPYVARHYAGNEARRHISTHRAEAVVSALGMNRGSVLDVGCGPGFSSVLLARKGATVTALDIDPVKLRIAKRFADLNGVDLEVALGDASGPLKFPDNHFDGLLSLELIEHIADWRGLVAQMVRVVKPGGRMAISTPSRHGVAQLIKTFALRTGLKAETTYEWFIPRRQMFDALRSHGVRLTEVTEVVLTAPMLPDAVMPLVKQIERLSERTPGLNRLCSTTIYCGVKAG